ncbi:Uncharacterised protein [Staphylococcus petrasii]|nr:Uncharacterised protein [Staphylococcus petrasii]
MLIVVMLPNDVGKILIGNLLKPLYIVSSVILIFSILGGAL